jgi:hypothetical protein
VGRRPEGRRAVARLRRIGRPIADNLRPLPYLFLQSMVDGGKQHGMHWYWRSQRLPGLADDVVDAICGLTDAITSPLSYTAGFAMGGAAGRVDPDAAALEGLRQAGLPGWMAENIVAVFGMLRDDPSAQVTDAVPALTGGQSRHLADHAALFAP